MARLFEVILDEFCKRLLQEGLSQARVAALRELLSGSDKPKPDDVVKVLSESEAIIPPGVTE